MGDYTKESGKLFRIPLAGSNHLHLAEVVESYGNNKYYGFDAVVFENTSAFASNSASKICSCTKTLDEIKVESFDVLCRIHKIWRSTASAMNFGAFYANSVGVNVGDYELKLGAAISLDDGIVASWDSSDEENLGLLEDSDGQSLDDTSNW